MDDIEKSSQDLLDLTKEDLEALFEGTINQELDPSEKSKQKYTPNTPLFEGSVSPGFLPQKNKSAKDEFPTSPTENFKADRGSSGARSSLRMKYEAEVEHIKKVHGDLESIRRKLKLSKRKVSQLLMVDPSAWTRWTRKGGEAPPHIYRSLEWYLLLQDKHPEYRSSLWLNTISTPQISEHEISNLKNDLLDNLRTELENFKISQEKPQARGRRKPFPERELRRKEYQLQTSQKRIKWLLLGQAFLIAIILTILLSR